MAKRIRASTENETTVNAKRAYVLISVNDHRVARSARVIKGARSWTVKVSRDVNAITRGR